MLPRFIQSLQSRYIYCFSRTQAEEMTGLSGQTLSTALLRYVMKGDILNVRRGVYIIIPLEYRSTGTLPLELYIDEMMPLINKEYYVGMYNAARVHGASHYAIMEDYVMTTIQSPPDIRNDKVRINFFSVRHWPKKNIQRRKFASGSYNISSPALTAVDLIKHQNQIGGINKVFGIIQELQEEITSQDLRDLVSWYPYKANVQRLGYLLELSESDEELLNILDSDLEREKQYATSLVFDKNATIIGRSKRWKINVNAEIDEEL
jgi:predicted transcriptional regulator of viral defense system